MHYKGGIYQIRNISNGKIYIGSTNNFKKRFYEHRNKLNNNKHTNKHLLASWNKWGEKVFVFEILEICSGTINQIRIIEQNYINNLITNNKWYECYNVKKKTIIKDKIVWSYNPENTKRKIGQISKKLWTDERKKNASERLKEMWKNPSYRERMKYLRTGQTRSVNTKNLLKKQKLGSKNPMWGGNFSKEHREKMSIAHKGKKFGPRSEAIKKKMSENRKGKGCHPCSEDKKRKLSLSNKNKKPNSKSIARSKEINSKTYNIWLLSPNKKEIFLTKNAAEFCKKYNLSKSSINKLINGKIKAHKGWTIK